MVPGRLHADDLLENTITDIKNWVEDVFPEGRQEGAVQDSPDSIRIVLTGDLPIPEPLPGNWLTASG